MKKFIVFLLLIPFLVLAQSSWKRTEAPVLSKVELFHASKTANYPTTENLRQGNFIFEISHRFASINEGYDNFFGLDGPVNMRLSLGYGINDDLMVTLGRSNVFANLDLALKYKLMDFDNEQMPSSLALNGGLTLISKDAAGKVQTLNADYMQYFGQLVYNIMFFDKKLALGVVPSFVYNSFILAASRGLDKETTISLGTYYQYYFNRMWSIWADYTTVVSGYNKTFYDNNIKAYDPLSFGLAIETGGHIFHLFVTNTTYVNPTQFLIGSDFKTDKKAWRFGFTITREL